MAASITLRQAFAEVVAVVADLWSLAPRSAAVLAASAVVGASAGVVPLRPV